MIYDISVKTTNFTPLPSGYGELADFDLKLREESGKILAWHKPRLLINKVQNLI